MLSRLLITSLSFSTLLLATSLDFDTLPSWKAQTTGSEVNLATWEIEKKDKSNILTITKIESSLLSFGGTFNLFFTKEINFKDGEISVDFKANSGRVDQGGGIMWRVADKDNYYVARFNPLEDNFRFYSVTDGHRKELKSVNIKLKKGWHNMKIIQKGDHFEGYLDGEKLLEATDGRITKAGGVGLWTKADAATSFDNFKADSK